MAKVLFIVLYDSAAYGLRTMSAVLEEHGHTPYTIQFKKESSAVVEYPSMNHSCYENLWPTGITAHHTDINPWTETELRLLCRKIEEIQPDVIGLSSRSNFDFAAVRLLRRLKERFSDVFLLAGGFGPTIRPDLYLDAADGVAIGESEDLILPLAEYFDGKRSSLASVPGLTYIEDGRILKNPLPAQIEDLDRLPLPKPFYPDTFLIDEDSISPVNGGATCFILSSRGCPALCTYCTTGNLRDIHRSYEANYRYRSYRIRSVDSLIAELRQAITIHPYRALSFLNPILMGPYAYMRELLVRMRDEIGIPFFAYLDVRQMLKYPDLLELAVEAGLHATGIGIQSGCERFSHEIYRRTVKNEDILRLGNLFMERGVKVDYQLITGNPIETEEHMKEAFAFIGKLPRTPDQRLVIFRLTNLNGTALTRRLQAKGYYTSPPDKFLHDGWRLHLRYLIEDNDVFRFIAEAPILKECPQVLRYLFPETVSSVPSKYTPQERVRFIELIRSVHDSLDGQNRDRKPLRSLETEARRLLFQFYVMTTRPDGILTWGNRDQLEGIADLFHSVEHAGHMESMPQDGAETNVKRFLESIARFGKDAEFPVFPCFEGSGSAPSEWLDCLRQLAPERVSTVVTPDRLTWETRNCFLDEIMTRTLNNPALDKFYHDAYLSGPVVLWGFPSADQDLPPSLTESRISAWVDHDPAHQGTSYFGAEIHPPESLNTEDTSPIIILDPDRRQVLDHIFKSFPHLWDRVCFHSLGQLDELRLIYDPDKAERTLKELDRIPDLRSSLPIRKKILPVLDRLQEHRRQHRETWESVDTIRDAYLNALYFMEERRVIVWGAKDLFHELEPIFSDRQIVVLIDEDSTLQGKRVRGIPVSRPAALKGVEDLPIFICTRDKPRVVKYIQERYPRFSQIP